MKYLENYQISLGKVYVYINSFEKYIKINMIILYLYIILKPMQEKMNIEIDKELYDDIQILKQVIPQETD